MGFPAGHTSNGEAATDHHFPWCRAGATHGWRRNGSESGPSRAAAQACGSAAVVTLMTDPPARAVPIEGMARPPTPRSRLWSSFTRQTERRKRCVFPRSADCREPVVNIPIHLDRSAWVERPAFCPRRRGGSPCTGRRWGVTGRWCGRRKAQGGRTDTPALVPDGCTEPAARAAAPQRRCVDV